MHGLMPVTGSRRLNCYYESGKTRIPVDNLLILAKFYNISMDYIAGAGNIKSEYPKA